MVSNLNLLTSLWSFYGSLSEHFMAMSNLSCLSIGSGPIPFRDRDWKNQNPLAKELIMACLEVDPSKRISVDDALQHPWFECE